MAGAAPLSSTRTWVTTTATAVTTSTSSSSSSVSYASAASVAGVGGSFTVPRTLLAPPGASSSSRGNCSRLAFLAYLASPGRLRVRLASAGLPMAGMTAGAAAGVALINNASASAAARLADAGRTTRPWQTFDLGPGARGHHRAHLGALSLLLRRPRVDGGVGRLEEAARAIRQASISSRSIVDLLAFERRV